MNFNFILDEDYLAYFILNRGMFYESRGIKNIFKLSDDIGYKKILEEEILDLSIYLSNNEIKKLIDEFVLTDKFNEIYKLYSSEDKYAAAIKILKNVININDNNLNELKDSLWFKYTEGYRTLLNINSYNPSYFMLDKDVKKTIQTLKEADEFKKIYRETELYLKSIREYWENNQHIINQFLKKVLRIDFNLEIKVYISHPNTCVGYSFGNNNVAWGHYNGVGDSNYNLIYLVHEGLHCLIPFGNNETDIECYIKHTIIELIADYELYSSLKGESTLNEGHPYLNEYRKFIYPYWLMYIGLEDFEREQRMKKDLVEYPNMILEDNFCLSKMNIHEFIAFCVKKYLKDMKTYMR